MTIAVHIDLTDQQNDPASNFNYNCFIVLAARHPGHHFIFIFDKPFDASLISCKNITPVLMGPQIKNRLLQHYFYNFKIPRLLNKYNAAFFFSTDTCSLRTDVTQCLILHDLSFLQKKNLFAKNDTRYLKRYNKIFVKKAGSIIVLNGELKNSLAALFPFEAGKINVAGIGIKAVYHPQGYEKADLTREKISEGKQYFVFFATESSAENIITMLKAFSLLKKWQKSNMQLLILLPGSQKDMALKELPSYKYRADVKVLHMDGGAADARIIAASYAAIHLPSMELTETEGLHSMACAVPLITTGSAFNKNVYKDAALYTLLNEKDISEKMMLLYKDEQTRNDLVNKGIALAASHTWQRAADVLWKTIEPDTAI